MGIFSSQVVQRSTGSNPGALHDWSFRSLTVFNSVLA